MKEEIAFFHPKPPLLPQGAHNFLLAALWDALITLYSANCFPYRLVPYLPAGPRVQHHTGQRLVLFGDQMSKCTETDFL